MERKLTQYLSAFASAKICRFIIDELRFPALSDIRLRIVQETGRRGVLYAVVGNAVDI